jgi:PAS domain S-box-containing protein
VISRLQKKGGDVQTAADAAALAPNLSATPTNSTADRLLRIKPRIEAPLIILLALLLATGLSAYQSYQKNKQDIDQRFTDIALHAVDIVVNEFHNVEDAMELAGTVIAASPTIDNARWNTYLDQRKLRERAVVGLIRLEYRAVSKSPDSQDAAAPPSLVRLYTDSPNEGSDVLTGVHIQAAFQESRRTQMSVVTTALGSVAARSNSTVTAPSSANTGSKLGTMRADYIALVRPVYAAFMVTREPIGYMVAVIRTSDLLTRAINEEGRRIQLAVLESNTVAFHSPEYYLHANAAPMRYKKNIVLGRRDWQVEVVATPALKRVLTSSTPITIVLVGVVATTLLAGLVWLLTRLREQATSLANSMTMKLRDQIKFTDDLIELNPNPIYRKDSLGRLMVVNRAWEQLHRRQRNDVIGKTSREFLNADDAERAELFDQAVLASRDGFEARESSVTTADGKRIPTILAKQVIRRADGTIDGIIGTLTDVTQVKELQREVARQREQLDMVIMSSQQGIFDVDASGGGRAYFSERFKEILGYTNANFPVRFEWRSQIVEADRLMFYEHIVEHFKHETPFLDVECRAYNAARSSSTDYVWLRIRALAQYGADKRATRLVGSIVDISDRRESEQKLIEANIRVTDAAKAKEAFLATMSHEIRTPMNGVLGMTGLLEGTRLDDEQRDYIRLIRASGDTLLRLINDVLDFSKIESGRMTLESTPLEWARVVEEAYELVAESARHKQLSLVYDIDPEVPTYLQGDITRLRQVLLNLLSNAIKFTDKGEIALTTTCQPLTDGKIELTVSISDTGIGIPANRISSLFEPFTQVDATTTRKYGGTGLGLAIVKRLVTMMNGTVAIVSKVNVGTTITFTMVTRPDRGPTLPHMQIRVPEFLGKRLLFVDESAHRRKVVQQRFPLWGLSVECVEPTNAIKIMRQSVVDNKVPDVVQIDVGYVMQHGDEMRRFLAEQDALRETKTMPRIAVIIMSSYSRAELAALPGFVPFRHDFLLIRPISRARMFDVLMQIMTGQYGRDVSTRPYAVQPVHDADYALLHSVKVPPLAVGTISAERAPNPAEQKVVSLNVLVAEDNEVNQRVIEGILRRMGHRATIVEDGQAAVDAMREVYADTSRAVYDIVLMDIHMPVLDGVGATKAIKQLYQEQAILRAELQPAPIVAMTAHALPGDKQHYLAQGLDDYIAKPLRNQEIMRMLARQLPDKIQELTQPIAGFQQNSSIKTASVGNSSTMGQTDAAQKIMKLPLLDMEQLEDLRGLPVEDGDDSGANGLITLFKTKSQERLRIIASSLVDADWTKLGDTSHSLRGAAASIGFPRVAAACKLLELSARRLAPKAGVPLLQDDSPLPTQGQLDEMFELLTRHFFEAEIALDKWLAASPD